MVKILTFIGAFAFTLVIGVSASAQPKGWKTASDVGLKFDVPREFRITSGTGPGVLSDGMSSQSFELNYLTAANLSRYIFAAAGYGYVTISPYFQGDMDDLATLSLSKILSNLNVPGIGTMRIDVANAEVAEYKTMGIQVSETKALSEASGRKYRVYFALAFRRASNGRARMVYMLTGGPDADIEENNQVMSTILSSFKEPSDDTQDPGPALGRTCRTPWLTCGPFYNLPAMPVGSPCYCATPSGPINGLVIQP